MPSRASRITFFIVFAITGFLFYRTMRPIFTWIGMGAFCAVLTYHPYLRVTRVLGHRRRLAAALCTAAVMGAVVVPLGLAGWQVAVEGLALAHSVAAEATSPSPTAEGSRVAVASPHVKRPLAKLREMMPISGEQLRSAESGLAQHATASITSLMSSLAGAVLGLFLWVLSLFYFYLDGERWLTQLAAIVPLPERHSVSFFQEFRQVVHAVFLGNIVTAALVGVVCGLGLLIAGVPGAALLGGLVFVAAILPLVGGALVWAPSSIWLFLHGHHGSAVFLAVWCAAWSLVLDHLLRPLITHGQLEMHPLLVFLSIFGGVAAFGFAGILLGPLFAALFLAAVRIYAAEFPARDEPPGPSALPVQPFVAH